MFYGQPTDLRGARIFVGDRMRNDESIVLLAILGGSIVGFTQLYPIFSSVRMRPVFILNDLYVEASVRKKGVGTQLIKAAQQLVNDMRYAGLSLETAKDNAAGNSLYPQLGFKLDDQFNTFSWTPDS